MIRHSPDYESIIMDKKQIEFTVQATGERLDKLVLAHLESFSRVQAQNLIKAGDVLVDGQHVKPGIKLRGGEQIIITIPAEENHDDIPHPEDIPLNIIYEDDHLVIIDKASDMVVHPGVGNESGTLVNALLAKYPHLAQLDDAEDRHGIVHRLDKDTSGLMVVAKTLDALDDLMAQFRLREVDKTYLALLERTPKTLTGRIDAPIARDPKQRKRMAVVRDGKAALSEFKVIDDDFRHGQALVEFTILTGRTHQIRVHAAFIGCPVVGDTIYGFRKQRVKMKRNFLHAARLGFDHPESGERIEFKSELPVGLQQIMMKLR